MATIFDRVSEEDDDVATGSKAITVTNNEKEMMEKESAQSRNSIGLSSDLSI